MTKTIPAGTHIEKFMTYYRENFPDASVLPKMHLMEDHMVPWMEKFHVGLGLKGEQGAESIHASINGIKRAYANMPDRVKRLHCILLEHHRHVCPVLVEQQPTIKRRNFKKKPAKVRL